MTSSETQSGSFPALLKNKYFITAVLFLCWMLFFDTNKLPTQYGLRKQLNDIEREQISLRGKVEDVRMKVDGIKNDPKMQEKIAREKYGMKRADEDVYTIISEQKKY